MKTKYMIQEGKMVKVDEAEQHLISYEFIPVGRAVSGTQNLIIKKRGKVIFEGIISDSMPNDVKLIDEAISKLIEKLNKTSKFR